MRNCTATSSRVFSDAGHIDTPGPPATPAPVRGTSPARDPSLRRRLTLANDPCLVAPLVAQLRNDLVATGFCDTRASGQVGVALEEAILNAIYHGNLEISSELKENTDGPFQAKVRERQCLSPYRERAVRVVSQVTPDRAIFVIADEGPGFDVASLPDATDPDNLLRASGRGLLLMRALMDTVRYNATGNAVTLVKLRQVE